MDLYKKKHIPLHFVITSQPRKVYDLEDGHINSVFWLRNKRRDISGYLDWINLENQPKTFVISNALEDKIIDDFFNGFSHDYDDFRKGQIKLKEEVIELLKMVTILNPKRHLEVNFITNADENLEFGYSESEINLVCSYMGSGIDWKECQENSIVCERTLSPFDVAIFKGANYPGSLSPLEFKLRKEANFTIHIRSYLAEH